MADNKYDDTNRGVLFKNSSKEEGDKRPDYTGNLDVGGVKYKLAGWSRVSEKSGVKFLSITVQEADGDRPRRSSKPAAEVNDDAF